VSGSITVGGPTVAVTGPPGGFPFKFGPTETFLGMADGIVGVLLAISLAVLGILTLVGSPRARGGHLVWAWLKLPAVVLTGAATAAATKAMFVGVAAMAPAAGAGSAAATMGGKMALIQGILYALVTMIYPVAILIVMRTRGVREYYEAGAGRAVA
jgi:hypothetical protein